MPNIFYNDKLVNLKIELEKVYTLEDNQLQLFQNNKTTDNLEINQIVNNDLNMKINNMNEQPFHLNLEEQENKKEEELSINTAYVMNKNDFYSMLKGHQLYKIQLNKTQHLFNWAKWRNWNISSYSFDFQKMCFCYPPISIKRVTIHVENNYVKRVDISDDETLYDYNKIKQNNFNFTLNDLFEMCVNGPINKKETWEDINKYYDLQINYNPVFGYVEHYKSDRSVRIADEELSYKVFNIKFKQGESDASIILHKNGQNHLIKTDYYFKVISISKDANYSIIEIDHMGKGIRYNLLDKDEIDNLNFNGEPVFLFNYNFYKPQKEYSRYLRYCNICTSDFIEHRITISDIQNEQSMFSIQLEGQ